MALNTNSGATLTIDALVISSTGIVALDQCDIHHNLDEGIQVSGGAGVSPVFTNVTVRDNGDAAVEQVAAWQRRWLISTHGPASTTRRYLTAVPVFLPTLTWVHWNSTVTHLK